VAVVPSKSVTLRDWRSRAIAALVPRDPTADTTVVGGPWRVGRWIVPAALLLALMVTRRVQSVLGTLIGPTEAKQPHVGRSFADFRDTVRLPVRDLLAGFNPYDAPAYMLRHPYAAEFDLYAPAHLTLFSPLALLPWRLSADVYFAFLMVSAVVIAGLIQIAGRLPRRADLLLLLTTVVLATRPMDFMVTYGQTSVVPGIAALLALMRRRTDLVTTLAVAVAWLKPQFGIPVCALLLVLGLWRPVVRGTAIMIVVSLPALVLATSHAGGVGAFIASIPRNLQTANESPFTSPAQSLLVRLDVAGFWASVTGQNPPAVLTAGLMFVVIATGAFAFRRLVVRGEYLPLAFLIATATVLLCLPHARYDLVLVLPALAGLATVLLVGAGSRLAVGVTATLVGLLALSALRIQRIDLLLGLTVTQGGRLSSATLLLAWCLAVAGVFLLTSRRSTALSSGP
jgi:hypothetical protein